MYNLIIDLEMCNVPKDYRRRSYKYANETIQIGAVLLDENFKRISTLGELFNGLDIKWAQCELLPEKKLEKQLSKSLLSVKIVSNDVLYVSHLWYTGITVG